MAASYPETKRTTGLGFLLVLGIALLHTGIALADTLVMATADRARELAVLRLSGATTGQVLRLAAGEALPVVLVSAVVGALAGALNPARIGAAEGLLDVGSAIVIPWGVIGTTVGARAALAVVSAVTPAAPCLRRRAVEAA